VELSGVVPLPISVADNAAAAFLPLAGEAPLPRVVRTVLGAVADPARVIVAAAEPLVDHVRAVLASQNIPLVSIVAVTGPTVRVNCLDAALDFLVRASFSTSHVLIHDISCPLASVGVRDRVIAGLRGGSTVVMPALPVTDSIKAVDVHGSVIGTLDRSALRAVQFPRGFAVDQLAGLLALRASEDFDELTTAIDTAAHITAVDGDPDAFRADLPRDAEFVEAIIASRPSDPHES
jgi:2-C-methyl-D-erythritol 4-phosphate cytidylyltransferase